MAARTSPQDAGKAFAAGVLQHLPDALRTQMESFLESPDATGFLTDMGNGALRQSDYSRHLNEVQAQRGALDKWHKELTQWVNDQGNDAPIAPVATPATQPATPATTAGLTREDFQDAVAAEFGRRETFYATFTADAVRLAQQHYQMFGETLDINQILQHPRLGELRMDGAYQDLFKDQLAARNAKIEAEKLQKLEAEIRAKVVSELRQNPAGGGLPYPVGSAPSPLDHLTPQGQTPQAFDPNAVAAAYEQLVASKA